MACLHPLKAIPVGINPKTGKTAYRIVKYEWNDPLEMHEAVEIPCGACVGCRKQNAYDWQQRAVAELQGYDKSSFVTLTYDQEHVPKNADGAGTLRYEDFQKFMKRLRKVQPDLDIRYFGCGEYGSKKFRPHFHAIVYGYDFPDKQFEKMSSKGSILYTSDELARLWPYGMCDVGDVNAATCGYVAGYIASKIGKYSNSRYKDLGVLPPKLFASRRPSIGLRWFEQNVDKYLETDVQYVKTEHGAFPIGLPRYFKNKLEILNPELYNQIKDSAKLKAEYVHETKLAQTDKDYLDMLESQEVNMLAAVKANKRDLGG